MHDFRFEWHPFSLLTLIFFSSVDFFWGVQAGREGLSVGVPRVQKMLDDLIDLMKREVPGKFYLKSVLIFFPFEIRLSEPN